MFAPICQEHVVWKFPTTERLIKQPKPFDSRSRISKEAKPKTESPQPRPLAFGNRQSAMAYLSALRRTSSSLLRKSLTLSSSSSSSFSRISSRHRFSASLFNRHVPDSVRPLTRFCTTTPSSEPDSSRPSWAAAAELDDTVIIEGCDFEHWLVIMGFPEDPKPSEEEMVDTYIKTLATVVGSEEEAKKKIYSVSTTTYTGFGALISRELSKNLKGLPGVLWVLPDSYLDVPSKDYGGDLLVDGKVVPRPEFRFREQEERMEYDFSDVEESEVYEEHEKRTEDSEESSLLFERLRETMENLKQSESDDSEDTRGKPTKNAETKAEGRTEKDLEGLRPVFDRLREKMKTLKQEPSSHKDLEETADEKEKAALVDRLREKIMNAEKKPLEQSKSEESEGRVEESEDEEDTAALFDRLREQMKNLTIENSGEHPDWPDMWPDEYYEKAQEPKKKVTQERLDVMKLQIQKFRKEIMQHKAENNDGIE